METIKRLFNEFTKSPSIETYIPLYNRGIYMKEWRGNKWTRVSTYKSDFSNVKVNTLTYSCIEPLIVDGVWVTIN